jgi:hypothetical protein
LHVSAKKFFPLTSQTWVKVLQQFQPILWMPAPALPGSWLSPWPTRVRGIAEVTDDREVPNDELARIQRQYQQAMSDIIYLFKTGQNPPKHLMDRAADLHRKAEKFRT